MQTVRPFWIPSRAIDHSRIRRRPRWCKLWCSVMLGIPLLAGCAGSRANLTDGSDAASPTPPSAVAREDARWPNPLAAAKRVFRRGESASPRDGVVKTADAVSQTAQPVAVGQPKTAVRLVNGSETPLPQLEEAAPEPSAQTAATSSAEPASLAEPASSPKRQRRRISLNPFGLIRPTSVAKSEESDATGPATDGTEGRAAQRTVAGQDLTESLETTAGTGHGIGHSDAARAVVSESAEGDATPEAPQIVTMSPPSDSSTSESTSPSAESAVAESAVAESTVAESTVVGSARVQTESVPTMALELEPTVEPAPAPAQVAVTADAATDAAQAAADATIEDAPTGPIANVAAKDVAETGETTMANELESADEFDIAMEAAQRMAAEFEAENGVDASGEPVDASGDSGGDTAESNIVPAGATVPLTTDSTSDDASGAPDEAGASMSSEDEGSDAVKQAIHEQDSQNVDADDLYRALFKDESYESKNPEPQETTAKPATGRLRWYGASGQE